MPLVLYNNKLLVVDGALATSLDCCCDQHVCCYCVETQSYTSLNRGDAGLKPWGGVFFQVYSCSDCYTLGNGQGVCIPIGANQPPDSVFTNIFCSVSVACRVADMAWNGGLPGRRQVNTGDDNLIGDPWTRSNKRSVCDSNTNEEECTQCRELAVGDNGLIIGFTDDCGIFAEGRVCKNPNIRPWDGGCDIDCCSDPIGGQ